MEIVAFILFIVAAVIFALSSYAYTNTAHPAAKFNGINLGLAILTVGFIVEFCSKHHQVHF